MKTIAAISTPPGEGGIGIIRLSGPDSLSIINRISSKKIHQPHRLMYAHIINPKTEEIIDEVLISYHKAPRSYTKEDVIEINGHSGLVVLQRILEVVLICGARLAEPGEFTKRAYLNGRIDLAQAEAVASLISAKTELARKVALSQLKGDLSAKIKAITDEIFEIFTRVSASLDFEEVEELDRQGLLSKLTFIKKELDSLIQSFTQGRFLSSCAVGVIVGRPNVGKSSILNGLLGEDRAIVTPIPGTTRDLVSETIDISGACLKITDTAGLTHAIDIVEKEGVKRAKKAMESADIVIFVIDGSEPLSEETYNLIEGIRNETIICINKIDLKQRIDRRQIERLGKKSIFTSAKKGDLSELKDAISKVLLPNLDESHLITNIRHKEALKETASQIAKAITNLKRGAEEEIIAYDLKEASDSISEITGKRTTEEMLDKIFASFCIGK
ncbi:MAG: tRNA uridine-5-carboxymethylaminomethyl(34) synthesis GTPase MnmE [bacterium]|nr:tRNA uridine-5-carboxymethylaminomethyl(34) synthesis GTPase MnmE [bacterium]